MAKNFNNPDYEPGGLLKLAGYKQLPWIQTQNNSFMKELKKAIKHPKIGMSIDVIDGEGELAYRISFEDDCYEIKVYEEEKKIAEMSVFKGYKYAFGLLELLMQNSKEEYTLEYTAS